MLWQADTTSGQDWMSDDSITSLGKSLRRGNRRLATGDVLEVDEEPKDAVEEFFAREAESRRKD